MSQQSEGPSATGSAGQDGSPRILVVDDVEQNLRVALFMLNKLDLQGVAVQDGQQALDALGRDSYDLVLMDVQMPVMDGLEATRKIREGAAGAGHCRLPVVALTAFAAAADRRNCLAAGMDDFLSKPIELPPLKTALARLLPRACSRLWPPVSPRGCPPPACSAWLDFDDEGTLDRFLMDDEELAEIMPGLLDKLRQQVQQLQAAIGAGEGERILNRARALKGAAANLGAERVRGVAEGIEQAALAGDAHVVRQARPALTIAHERLRQAVACRLFEGQLP